MLHLRNFEPIEQNYQISTLTSKMKTQALENKLTLDMIIMMQKDEPD